MSILKKENKFQTIVTDDMFDVKVSCAFNNDIFTGLRNKIEQVYSKDILRTILNIDTHKHYDFGKVGTLRVIFSTLGVYRMVYKSKILDRLEWNIGVHISNDTFSSNQDNTYMLHIYIKTDGAREFVSDLLSETLKRLLKE